MIKDIKDMESVIAHLEDHAACGEQECDDLIESLLIVAWAVREIQEGQSCVR